MFFAWKGVGDEAIVLLLTLLNFVALTWLILNIVRSSDGLTNDKWLLLAVIGFGPLYAFSVYSFSESLTFVLTAALVLAISQHKNFAIPLILAFILSSSRETALFSVLPIALSALLISEN